MIISAPTYFHSRKPLRMIDLFSGALAGYGLEELITKRTTFTCRMLSDGEGGLWVHANEEGFVTSLSGHSWVVGGILYAIEEVFETTLVSEHEPEFWGFSTEEEWRAWEAEMIRKQHDAFYSELLRYTAGQPNSIKPGTLGETMAAIAKELVAMDPSLLLPENKERWLTDINRIFYGDSVTATAAQGKVDDSLSASRSLRDAEADSQNEP